MDNEFTAKNVLLKDGRKAEELRVWKSGQTLYKEVLITRLDGSKYRIITKKVFPIGVTA